MTTRKMIKRRSPERLRWLVLCLSALALLLCTLPTYRGRAANPNSGTIAPSAATPVTWQGTATAGGAPGESSCVEGANCDTFTLNVSGTPADWTGKIIKIRIAWTNPANDYDLYVHKDANFGPIVGQSADGPPSTNENTSISPSGTGTGIYTVHVVYFAVTPQADQYQGSATVAPAPPQRPATYVKGGITFSPNVTVKAPATGRDGEPSSRTDPKGNFYVAGIRGVPAGVDLWYHDLRPTIPDPNNPLSTIANPNYDPLMRNYIYRGQPDSLCHDVNGQPTNCGPSDGGGDVDVAVGLAPPGVGTTAADPSVLAFSSLVASNISVGKSLDRGITFTNNPLGNLTGGPPGDDREWQEFYGNNVVYLFYRTLNPAVPQVQRSDDGGLTYGPTKTTLGNTSIGQAGAIDVHQRTGRVFISGSQGKVCVGDPPTPGAEPLFYACHQVTTEASVANIFFVVKVADDGTANGTVYVAYSDGKAIFLRHSTDNAVTWSDPVRVSDGAETRTSLFPWLETGPVPGSVGVVWYGTSETTNSEKANWKTFYAQSFDATSAQPTFRQVEASDHFIHGSNISTGGTLGSKNRNLLDYFQLSYDPAGAAVIAITDDHNDFDGHTYVMRQTAGPSINGGTLPAPAEGGSLPATPPGIPPQPGANGEQVTDFLHDARTSSAVIGIDDAADILSIKYTTLNQNPNSGTNTGPVIEATMKVSGSLATAEPGTFWRMNFTANAPGAGALGGNPGDQYSFGISDHGDQFFLRANNPSGSGGPPTSYSWGQAIRNSDGTLTYTTRGPADCGSFDTANNTITVRISANKLNQSFVDCSGNTDPAAGCVNGRIVPFPRVGGPVAAGTIMSGLRGQTGQTPSSSRSDLTRGGTEFTVGNAAGNSSCLNVAPPAPAPASTIPRGQLLISEFRLRGPDPDGVGPLTGENNEFIELYNNSDAPLTVSTSDGSIGWTVLALNADGVSATTKFIIPNNTTIPARGHYLGVNTSGYSLSSYPANTTGATGDNTYTDNIPDNAGLAVFSTANSANFQIGFLLDAVGFSNSLPNFFEGTPLAPVPAANNEQSFVRKMLTGLPQDTNDNAADFVIVSTDACIGELLGTPAACNGLIVALGAPGPENLNSPIQRNAQIKASLIDVQCPGGSTNPTSACARVRNTSDTGPNKTLGTLIFRRRFTNRTTQPVTRLRFRIVNITTLGVSAPNEADLRALNSGSTTVTRVDNTTVLVQGTTVETPPAQPLGGGLNSSMMVTLPGGSIAANNSVDVQFVLGVERGGSFRFFINVEAANGAPPPAVPSAKSKLGAPVKQLPTTPAPADNPTKSVPQPEAQTKAVSTPAYNPAYVLVQPAQPATAAAVQSAQPRTPARRARGARSRKSQQ